MIEIDTLWSIVGNLNKKQLFRSEGNPMNTKYEEDKRLE